MNSARILIVDDEPDLCSLLEEQLNRRGFDACSTSNPEEVPFLLETADVDAVLTDIRMPGVNGLELCAQIAQRTPHVPVVMITAFGNLETAVQAMRAGAFDFVTKPFDLDALTEALTRAVRESSLREKLSRIVERSQRALQFEGLIGESEVMRELYETISRIADSDASVLISGESGTGKELIAQALHRRSRRKDKPFVAVNCAAVPEQLLESELFGHTKGAFTDAHAVRKGLFLKAHGGTLFLDEIAELPLTLQPKLLRVLEERVVRPVGGDEPTPIDVRIVAATNRDLESDIASKHFREDLFFRINVLPINAPPLRSRGDDVLLLAQRFTEEAAAQQAKPVKGISAPAAQQLLQYDWPGNVRELRNVIERAVALTSYDSLLVHDLPEKLRGSRVPASAGEESADGDLVPMAEIEKRHVLDVLKAVGGNKAQAAKILGVDRKTLYRKLVRYRMTEE